MKKIICFILLAIHCLFTYTLVYGQVDIDSYGKMTIAAQTQDWESALRAKVATGDSYAFTMWTPGLGDVSFFHASGYLYCRLGGYFGSDSTMKQNIIPIESALNIIKGLNGVRYQFRPASEREQQEYDTISGHGYRFGFVAQEVEEVLPEVVKTMPDGKKSMTYTDIIAILVEAMKQQQSEIDRMREVLIEHGLMENDE